LSTYENGVCTFTQERAKNISTAAFYAVTVMVLFNVLTAALTFPLEIPIFFHEVIYSVLVFLLILNILNLSTEL
jgi:hypothetical protein